MQPLASQAQSEEAKPLLKRMKRTLLTFLLGVLLWGCDTTESDDLAPQADLPEPMHYTADPFSPLLIDVSDMIQGATFQVHELPARGTLQLWEEGLLIYTPATDFLNGTDHFSYRIITEGQVRTGQIQIEMQPESGCTWRPRSDSLFVHPGQQVRHNLMANDLFCDAFESTRTQLRIPPVHGTATLDENGNLSYSLTDASATRDRLAYRICHPETGICKDALVQIRPQTACAEASRYYPITELPADAPIINTAIAIREAAITGDCLRLTVSYSGGCGGTIQAQLVVEEKETDRLHLVMGFTENDRCEAIVSKNLFFDLSNFKQEVPLQITIAGYADTLFYDGL